MKLRRIGLSSLVVLVAALMLGVLPAASAESTDYVIGGGVFRLFGYPGAIVAPRYTVSVHARSGTLGEDPSGTMFIGFDNHFPFQGGDTRSGGTATAQVVCMVVADNRAVMVGEVTGRTGFFERDPVFAIAPFMIFVITDNGEPADGQPDRVLPFFLALGGQISDVCNTTPFGYGGVQTLSEGNFRIVDSQPS